MRNYSFLSQSTHWYKNKTESFIFAFNQRTRWYKNKNEGPIFALHQRTFWYKRKTQDTFSVLYQRLTYIEQKRVFRRTGKTLASNHGRLHTPSFEKLDILLSLCLVLFSTPNRQVVLFLCRDDLTLYAYVYTVPLSLNRILYVINSR